jgi:hypothetical protein
VQLTFDERPVVECHPARQQIAQRILPSPFSSFEAIAAKAESASWNRGAVVG